MNFRIGYGYDVHQLAEGEEFWLGGILLDYFKGGVGHSDADVLIHTICDAILGAANLRDIGFHFPDTDPELKGIDSKVLFPAAFNARAPYFNAPAAVSNNSQSSLIALSVSFSE